MIVEQIKSLLKDFTLKEENVFTKNITKQLPGQTIIINGQQIQQAGQVINVQFVVELFGDVCIDDEESQLMIHFTMLQDNRVIRELFESFYLDDIEKFKLVYNQFFNI
jgi:hypothetical protein